MSSLVPTIIPNIDPKTGLPATIISGDRAIALTAQLNRFRKANGFAEAPLVPGVITLADGLTALGILQARLTDALFKATPDNRVAINTQMMAIASAQGDPVAYVMPRLEEVTRTIAIWGDIQGYPPAKIGITQRDPRVKRWYQTWWGLGLIGAGSLALIAGAGHVALRARQ